VQNLLEESQGMQAENPDDTPNEGFYSSIAKEPPTPVFDRKLTRSFELKAKAGLLIPSVTQTFSKGPSQYVQGVAPVFLARGSGSHVWDVDGNEYIDYPMALGPVILGYSYPAVNMAAVNQIRDGAVFSLAHPLEIEVAQLLVDVIPCAEMVRFGKNGSDATSGAVRAARAYTGRDIVACCGYHGWQDWYIGSTTRNLGVPDAVRKQTIPFEYNHLASLEQVFADYPGQVAAVIMEPVGVIEPEGEFLQKVKALAHREGALLIFDEVVTGFRLGLGGAQEHYGVIPDLACFGKAMGNGFPIAAVVGRRDVMEIFDDIFFSFTFGGEAVSLAAAKATISELIRKPVFSKLWSTGKQIKDGFNVLAKEFGLAGNAQCLGLAPRTITVFTDDQGNNSLELKSLFQQECLKRGVLFLGGHNICYSHTSSDVNHTLRVYRTAMEICSMALREGDVLGKLEGPPVQAVFRSA
jgi:glutamate-1-semialdehyde aminotransferase